MASWPGSDPFETRHLQTNWHVHVQARYEILRSCLSELQRVGLIAGGAAPQPWEELRVWATGSACNTTATLLLSVFHKESESSLSCLYGAVWTAA